MGESDPIIRVENLGKKYVICHQQEGRGRYQSLRDTLTNGLRAAGRRLVRPFARTERPGKEEFWALKDVSFEVKRGEVVGIIGRNGAGKSTLLKVLSRITEPTTGRVTLHGRVASLLEVGTGFHPELTGRENVYLNGAILGMSRAEIRKKFDEIVAFAEVEKFLDTPAKRYSSGMYMRLAFAVAAHLEPEILVVDEVLAVGDAQFQKKCLGKMGEVAGRGRTVLFVSHNMAAVQHLCGSGIFLNKGRLSSRGLINEVVKTYIEDGQSAHVAAFDPRNRAGTGWAGIRDFRLVDSSGNRLESVYSDSELHFVCDVAMDDSRLHEGSLRGLIFQAMFFTDQGEPLFNVMSVDEFGTELPDAQHARVRFSLEKPTFIPGYYRLNLFLGIPFLQHVDEIFDAFRFEVLPPLRPSRPYEYESFRGHLIKAARWSIEEAPRNRSLDL